MLGQGLLFGVITAFFCLFIVAYPVSHKSTLAISGYISWKGHTIRHSQPVLKKLVSLDSVAVFTRLVLCLRRGAGSSRISGLVVGTGPDLVHTVVSKNLNHVQRFPKRKSSFDVFILFACVLWISRDDAVRDFCNN